MFQQLPERRLWLVKQRHAELIHDAEQHRLVRGHPDEPAGHVWTRLLDSLGAGLGRRLAAIRCALPAREAPCVDPCPDCAGF